MPHLDSNNDNYNNNNNKNIDDISDDDNVCSVCFHPDESLFGAWAQLRSLFLQVPNDARAKTKIFRMVEKSFQSKLVLIYNYCLF